MSLLVPMPWQHAALQLRTHVDLIVLAGGRGGGKTHCGLLGLIAHCNLLGEHAAPLVVRESWTGLSETLTKAETFAAAAFGTNGLSYNRSEGVIRLPTGGAIYGASLHDGESSYLRWQGRNLTGIWVEEAGNLSPQHFAFMRRLESNLRPPLGFKAERIWTANPHGKSHHTLYRNYIGKAPPWRMGRSADGLTYVWIPSTYRDNKHIDQPAYARNLLASVGSDHALAAAWGDGRWDQISGAMFPVNPEVHLIDPIPGWMLKRVARFTCGSDWGNSAPATAILLAQLKEPIHYGGGRLPYGSIIAIEETDTAADSNDLSVGLGTDARTFAEQVYAMLQKHGAERCDVVVDDAKGLKGDSVVDYFRSANLNARLPDKRSRVEGWDIVRQYLADAENGSGRPSLYVTTACPHLFETLSEAPRGTLNPRDLDPKWNRDHWCDALAYGMKEVAGGPRSWQGQVIGMW